MNKLSIFKRHIFPDHPSWRTPEPTNHALQSASLNTWFPDGGTVWRRFWNFLEAEPCRRTPWRASFDSTSNPLPVSRETKCGQSVPAPAPVASPPPPLWTLPFTLRVVGGVVSGLPAPDTCCPASPAPRDSSLPETVTQNKCSHI